MKIHLLSLVAGPDGVYHPGQRDLPDALAQRLIDHGHAVLDDGEPLDPSRVVVPAHETNTVQAAETHARVTNGPRAPRPRVTSGARLDGSNAKPETKPQGE